MTYRQNLKLKMLLFSRNLSQRAVALGTGLNEDQVSKATKYGISTFEVRRKIADFLDVKETEIF